MSDKRHNARMVALQCLFESSFPGYKPKSIETSILTQSSNIKDEELLQHKDYDSVLYNQIIEGVNNKYSEIDKIISKLAPEWPLDKINKIDLQILRIAILEAYILEITPEKVAINEAIELSREFSSEQSRKFVNGVLGNLLKSKDKFISK